MARALKVFRTAAGFHDAYVAAPSQRAALEAWGAEGNLFASGMAEVVTNPKLTKAPLAKPGQVIRLARGTAAQHLAALPKAKREPTSKATRAPKTKSNVANPQARPSRRALDAAEEALRGAGAEYRAAVEAITKREDALRRERQALEEKHEATLARLARKIEDVGANYERALDQWRG